MNPDTITEVVSAICTAGALFLGWLQWREASLRKEDVLAWANEVISVLESLYLVCLLNESCLEDKDAKIKITQIIFDTAILIERGRLFFRNEVKDDYGAEKESAYRGLRPLILDHIVVAHQIALKWNTSDRNTKLRMRLVAKDHLKMFVSLVQKEVGRDRIASKYAGESGDHVNLAYLLEAIDERQLAKAGGV